MASHLSTRKTRLIRLALCLFLVTSLAGLWAQSTGATLLHFPRFVAFGDVSSGIAIVNPSGRDAVATLTLFDLNGSQVLDVPNPVSVTIPARGQIARTAGDLFGTFDFIDASLDVSSSTPGLVAYYCTFDNAATFMDGADAPESGLSLIFPVVAGSGEGATEIDLLNTNIRPTAVELKLWSFDGDPQGQATVQVPAGGSFRALADNIFPGGTDFSSASHITATAKAPNVFGQAQTVSGTSLFAGFTSVPTAEGEIDIAALNALTLTQTTNNGVLPHFQIGSQFASVLSLANVEPANIDVNLTAVGNNGQNLGTRTIALGANGGFRAPLQSVFPALFGEQEGWILVQATGRVAGALIHGRRDAPGISAIPLQRTPQFTFVFPQAVQDFGMFSEVILSNPRPFASTVDVVVVNPDGETLASNQISIPANNRIARRLDEILPELAPLPGGYVYVRAHEPLFATLALWSDSGGTLTNFAPQPVSSSFSPAPLTSFAVTGTVTLNDLPAPGFRVVLSGPVGRLATTDADGVYIFTDVPAGKYSMTIDQFGFEFIPAQVNFELTTRSFRQDFSGSTAPNAILVQPSTIPVGTAATTVTVFGRDFNSTSTAFVGPVRLETTFVDSTQLQVEIPGFLRSTPNRFDLFVVTNDGTPDRRVSQLYPMAAFLNMPTLTSVSTDGSIVEGNPGATVRLGGSGFLAGAKVKVNGQSDGIEISLLDNAQIIAFLPARYFERGGIFPVTVENPVPANVESNIQLLTVFFPRPSIEEILPKFTSVRLEDSAGPLRLDILGFGFRRGAVVVVNGVPVHTTYCENDPFCLNVRLFATLPASFLRQSGFAQIVVQNPSPSLGSSEAAFLLIEGLQPTITSVLPGSATVLDSPSTFSMPVVVNGTNFGPQTQVRIFQVGVDEELPAFGAPDQVISTTQLNLNLTVTFESIGEWRVEVMNPQPGGGFSEPASFLITEGNFVANPFLLSLTPQVVAAGGPSFTLTVNGTNLRAGSQINFFSTPLVTTVVSDRQARAEVPANLIQSPGRVPISVTNPDNGGTSNRLFLDIR